MTTTPTEETPLLHSQAEDEEQVNAAEEIEHNLIYEKFSPWRKRIIVSIVSWAGFLPLFVSGSFTPTIPQIARDLDSDGATISLAISLSFFTTAFAGMNWAAYAGFYGRRPIYMTAMPCLCVGSLGVARATSVHALFLFRIVQAIGSSGGISLGPAVIGDIYKLEERGTAMGIFLATSLLGPSFSPLAGGLAATYASWRVLQYALAIAAFCTYFVMFWFLPETSHPGSRGVDKLELGARKWVVLNPLRNLWLLRSPNLLAVTLVACSAVVGIFGIVMPLAYTIGPRYEIKNEAVLAIFFSASGFGDIIGAIISGRISDHVIIKWRKLRKGKWVPEDRLRAALLAAGVLVPVPILVSGLVTRYVPGTLGMGINLACLFINGVGVDMVLTPLASYNVDVMHKQSAGIMSAHYGVRSLILAGSTMVTIPLINNIGVMSTDLIFAAICWIGFLLLWATIRYGEQMRAWVDVGYSTIQDT